MSKKNKKKPKGEKFKVIELDEQETQVFLSLMRQAPHEDSNAEVALEIIETLEALGSPIEDDEEGERLNVPYEFPDECPIIISVAAHTYLPNMFKKLTPNGLILKPYTKIKKAIQNAERIFDKPLMDEGWKREDGVWFPPESGPKLPENGDQEPPEESSPAEGEGEEAA